MSCWIGLFSSFPLSFSCFSFCLPLASDGLLKGIISKDSNKKPNLYFFATFFFIRSVVYVVLQRKSLILASKSIIFRFFMAFKWKYLLHALYFWKMLVHVIGWKRESWESRKIVLCTFVLLCSLFLRYICYICNTFCLLRQKRAKGKQRATIYLRT